MDKIDIETRDGVCPSYVHRPEGSGPWPAVLVYMDGPGIRPAMFEVGARLAQAGYLALTPDLFYRSGPYEPMDPTTLFSDPVKRKHLMDNYFALANAPNIMSDTGFFLDWLDAQGDVKPGGRGITGYCMGGKLAILAAEAYPGRISVAASFHGGGLVTDAPDSPHKHVADMAGKVKVYIGGAIEDHGFSDEAKQTLEDALTEAGVDHAIKTFPARHGWCLRDMPVFDEAQAERHYETLVPLLDGVLK